MTPIELKEMRLVDGTLAGTNGPQGEAVLNHRIEALKELAQALLKEVEALASTQHSEATRHLSLQEEVRRYEMDLIRRALVRTGGNQRKAARLLGIKVTTLNTKIKRYHINPETLGGVACLERKS